MLRVIVFLGVDVWPTLNGLSSVMIAVLVLVLVPCPSAWVAPFVAYGSSRRIAFSGTPASFGLVPGAVRDCLRCSHLARVDADAGVARLAILDNP